MKYALATVAAMALAAPAFAGDAKTSAPKTVVSTQGLMAGGLATGTAIVGGLALVTVIATTDSSSASGT